MKVTLLQHDIIWGNPEQNRRHMTESICWSVAQIGASDVYVLPEMFTTGFATEPAGIAETSGESLLWMQDLSDRLDAALAGSVAVWTGSENVNRLYFVKPGGVVEYYDKHHLFTYGGENRHYTAGNRRVVVEWRGVCFLLQVCYDLRFPVWSRNRGDYEAIIYVASWPIARRRVWDLLLQARAIENQCYVFGVNRVGEDPVCRYDGGTVAIDPYGRVMATCTDGEECSITVEMDMEKLRAFREKFPVLEDGDEFRI